MGLVPLTILARSNRNARRLAGVLLFFAFVLGGCAHIVPQSVQLTESWPAELPPKVELADVPFFAQDDYQCGPTALATTLRHAGVPVVPDDLVREVYLPARHGSLQVEMIAAPRRHGLVSYQLDGSLETVLREVAAGNPVIVLQDFGVWPVKIWHYAVVIGYERDSHRVIMRSGLNRRQEAPFAALEYTWKGSDRWAMVALSPQRIPATAQAERYTQAVVDFARVASPQAARRAYEAVLARWPGNVAAQVGLSNILYSAGDLKGSEALLRDAAARHPESVPVLNNLAQVLSDQGRLDEALATIQRAARDAGPYAAAVEDTRRSIEKRRAGAR
ncbi:MAG TPA: PA2778 family cysteine peptidase [Usitatibacter sp.]|nr:PA2778 family cysteine peptidase [Usitatibacter sp.]